MGFFSPDPKTQESKCPLPVQLPAADFAVHILVWGVSNPNYIGIAVAQVSYPLVRVGTTTGAKGQPKEANLEARACVPREFKGEAGRTQPQGGCRGRRPMAGRPL